MRHITLVAILLAGCANPISQHTAENYYAAGEQALARGDLPQAREMYSRALINARLGHMGDCAESRVLSKLGRVYGNLCDYAAEEQAFLEARNLDVRTYANNPNLTVPTRIELAQLSYDIGQCEKATQYFDEAFAVMDHRFKEKDPATYAAIRKDYADALQRADQLDKSREVLAELVELEGKSSAAKAGRSDDYVRYPTQCK